MRILVIEDNRDILANVLDYLELKGYLVDCAQDGLSGLHLAATQDYDLIVLDIMLPGIDGYQVCQRLRDDARRDTPIIMLTARDALPDRIKGLELAPTTTWSSPSPCPSWSPASKRCCAAARVPGAGSCRSATSSMTSTPWR